MASPFLNLGFLPDPPSSGAGGVVVGQAVSGGTASTFIYTDASGNVATSSDVDVAAAVAFGRLRVSSGGIVADHVHIGHFDKCSSGTNFQIRLDPDGDTQVKAPGVSTSLSLIGGDSGTSSVTIFVNASVNRITCNNTGVGFFAATPVAQQTVGAVTNSVTAGGVDGTIANYTDLAVYANDSAAIRNDIYQLARTCAQLATAVRNLGLGA